MTTTSCSSVYPIRTLSAAVVRSSTALALVMGSSVLLNTSTSHGAEDISKYQELREVLQKTFPQTGLIIIKQIVNGEPVTVAVFDPDYAQLVPRPGPATVENFTGSIQAACEVPTVTLSGSPACQLVPTGDGDSVWVPHPPPCP